ncbi:UNVERIFIED_CONTAM: hypothetical protein O8I53_10420 [Campylobacter lari]
MDFTEEDVEKVDIVIASTNSENKIKLFTLANELRSYGIKIDFLFDNAKSKKIFDRAKKLNAQFVIFDDSMLGENILVAKELKENDKLVFRLDEEGFVKLLDFLSFYELEALNELEMLQEEE